MALYDMVWHRWLRRPYKLAKPIDSGRGVPVVLLHGVGSSSLVWQPLVARLDPMRYRVVAFDLLGFGRSPKPQWLDYGVDDHAAAVIVSLEACRLQQPAILVGHSMGCLVAARVARRRPDLVRHLILYEMPLYEGLPDKRIYRARLNLYSRFYDWVLRQQPTFDDANQHLKERLAKRLLTFELTRDTWQPFVRSLRNTILHQTASDDIKHLSMPTDVIYGTWDMFVIGGEVRQIFGEDAAHINGHKVKARHVISAKASHFIGERIRAAANSPHNNDSY